ncbi:hypothetical protein AB9K34_19345 [Sedimentitalea sp. XS_ASV28]
MNIIVTPCARTGMMVLRSDDAGLPDAPIIRGRRSRYHLDSLYIQDCSFCIAAKRPHLIGDRGSRGFDHETHGFSVNRDGAHHVTTHKIAAIRENQDRKY